MGKAKVSVSEESGLSTDRRSFTALALSAIAAGVIKPTLLFAEVAPITVVELRQYTLRGGRREDLIDLFEREFIEPQEALGLHVLGIFRDLDDPDRFVWMRGFRDMAQRRAGLEAFYTGPVWKSHSRAANATMLDSDNVLLLQPLAKSAGLLAPQRVATSGLVRVSIHALSQVPSPAFTEFFEGTMRPVITEAGGNILATLISEAQPNDYPGLPVREHEPVFVWLTRFDNPDAEAKFTRSLTQRSGWRDRVPESLWPALMRKPEVLRLSPTSHSRLG